MIQTIAITGIAVSTAIACLYAAIIVLNRPRRSRAAPTLRRIPAVSVFITLRNMDDGLEENLASVLSQAYPSYEVYFAVDTLNDPCMPVIERVRARYPGVRSAVVAAGHSSVSNPKISKLAQLESRSDAELIWVLDSDVRVAPGTLSSLVTEYVGNNTSIVFSPVRCSGAKSFGSIVEMSYINFFLSGSILTLWKLLRRRVVVGKSLLIERRVLDHFGGFSYFADVLAEDHWLGETFALSGFKVRCSSVWVDNIKETTTVMNYFSRISRWAKLRYHLKKPVFLLESLLNPVALTLCALPVLKTAALPVALAVVAIRIALEYIVFFAVNNGERFRMRTLVLLPAAVLVKDILMIALYCLPVFSNSVNWREGRIKIGKYTMLPFCQENRLLDGA